MAKSISKPFGFTIIVWVAATLLITKGLDAFTFPSLIGSENIRTKTGSSNYCFSAIISTTTLDTRHRTWLFQQRGENNDDEEEDVELVGALGDAADSGSGSNKSDSDSNTLNIDLSAEIGKQMKPMTKEDKDEIKAEITELINDKFAEKVDKINQMREEMKVKQKNDDDLRRTRLNLDAQFERERLLSKVDKLVAKELDRTAELRQSNKLIEAARKNTNNPSAEPGTWGYVGDVAVPLQSSLVGNEKSQKESFGDFSGSSIKESQSFEQQQASSSTNDPGVLIIADESQDKVAVQVLPSFIDELKKSIPNVEVSTIKPTSTIPVGGNGAQCLIMFATSLNDGNSIKNMLKPILRRTVVAGGKMTKPPTQLILVSTVGTSRTNKMPYSMQNLIGGKLTKRLEIEDTLKLIVKQKYSDTTITSPAPLDYTVIKLGDIAQDDTTKNEEMQLLPGDVLDGSVTTEIAVETILQSVAFQPYARNSTLCVTGGKVVVSDNAMDDEIDNKWNDLFLQLDGPEIYRTTNQLNGPKEELIRSIDMWSQQIEKSKKLTTPVRLEILDATPDPTFENVKERYGVRFVFLPTNTGTAYLSRSEERQRQQQMESSSPAKSNNPPPKQPTVLRKQGKDGGVEVLVEVTNDDILRIRARRCNMDDNTVVKTLSEESILKSLKDKVVDPWQTAHQSS